MAIANNLKNWFSGFFKVDFSTWATSFGSAYGRRMMEPYYDKIAQTEFFKIFKDQEGSVKKIIEAANNALTAFLDQKIDDVSPLRKLIKEIFMDSSSELNKRMINGDPVKKMLWERAGKMNSKDLNFLSVLLAMEEEKLKPFLEWLISMSEAEKEEILKILKTFSAEDMENFSGMKQEMKEIFLNVFRKKKQTPAGKPVKEQVRSFLASRLKKRGR